MRLCTINGCERKHDARGMCSMHRRRMARYGRIERIRKNWNGEKRIYPHQSTFSMHKKRFGGLRSQILERDEYKCKLCGMDRDKHKELYKRDLTIDHIDGQGRYSKTPNNTLANLQTLCLSCHGKKDHRRKIIWMAAIGQPY